MRPAESLFRIAHRDPWQRHPLPKFANRFDDPDKTRQTLYACSQRLGAFVECLAPFRPRTLEALSLIGGPTDHILGGVVPREWVVTSYLGEAQVGGDFADICGAEWISRLRAPLALVLSRHGFQDLDASLLQQAKYRDITRAASKAVRQAEMNGIYYRSRHGHEF